MFLDSYLKVVMMKCELVKLSHTEFICETVCETSKLPHILDNRLTDGCDVSITRRLAAFSTQEES
jgi:hypothetical protein